MTTCRSDTCRPPRGDRGVTDLPLLRPIATATMWEIRRSPLRNNPGNRPRIYVGYNTSVLFELISARYEQRSLLITANQPFGQWDKIFPDPAMTVAAIDRLVHRATIFELNVESYRRRTAIDNKRSRQRAAAAAVETADQTAAAPSAPLRNGA